MSKHHDCPACGAGLVSEPAGTPFRCSRCDWHLITLNEWKKLSPLQQGFAFYMQKLLAHQRAGPREKSAPREHACMARVL